MDVTYEQLCAVLESYLGRWGIDVVDRGVLLRSRRPVVTHRHTCLNAVFTAPPPARSPLPARARPGPR
jgi:hypothetical protein